MKKRETGTFYPSSKKKWRDWLQKNHAKKESIWLIYYKLKAGMPTISWSEAVDEALCFGWIDSKALSIDEEKYKQFFTKRKPSSAWSKINKEKIKRLIEEGLMMPAGLASIEVAKQNGSWTILDEVEELTIPKDLEKAFRTNKGSKKFFLSLSKSVQKMILQWIAFAKREETRHKRITEVATLAAKQLKPKHIP